MYLLKRIIGPIWKAWFLLNFILSFLILYPFFYYTISTKKLEAAFKLKKIWSKWIAYGSFVFPKLVYECKSKKMPQPSVIIANHSSYLDIVVSTFYIDHLAIYLGKAELLKAPLFKIFFKGMDIPVLRTSRMDAHKAFVSAGEEIEKGRSMVIYPEGTIPKYDKLLPFKNGAFKLAIEKQVPIVPVINVTHRQLLENGGFLKSNGRPGIALTVILEPILTTGLTEKDIDELKLKVHELIKNKLIEYNGTKN